MAFKNEEPTQVVQPRKYDLDNPQDRQAIKDFERDFEELTADWKPGMRPKIEFYAIKIKLRSEKGIYLDTLPLYGDMCNKHSMMGTLRARREYAKYQAMTPEEQAMDDQKRRVIFGAEKFRVKTEEPEIVLAEIPTHEFPQEEMPIMEFRDEDEIDVKDIPF